MALAPSQLIFQRNGSMLVTPGQRRDDVAAAVRRCAELRAIVAGNYVYRLSPIALWGSAAQGITSGEILRDLDRVAAAGVPETMAARISELVGRYGVIEMTPVGDEVRITALDPSILTSLDLEIEPTDGGFIVPSRLAGGVKVLAARAGWPIVDRMQAAQPAFEARITKNVTLRPYQRDAVEAFRRAGNGVVLLPCGAGKTIVGVAALCQVSTATLILAPSRSVADQWRSTILDATNLAPEDVSLADASDSLTPVTIATYHAATMGQVAGRLLDYAWGLVIYDEVQSLPADMFRLSAALQSSRRLGLTATLVREDGRQAEVFALVGPPVFDVPWVDLQRQGWIAPAKCVEVRVPEAPSASRALAYKLAVVARLLHRHADQPLLIVGSNLDSLHTAGRRFDIQVLTGSSTRRVRSELLESFRVGEIRKLGLSRIGSVGIDLPGAEVLIQLTGTYGSRQEEAQRLGRLLRPSPGKIAHFYTIVSEGTPEVRYAEKRQRFLVEQGYEYEMLAAADLPRPARTSY